MSNVLILSTTSYYSPFKVGSYHIANSLAERGDCVTFVSAPVSLPVLISFLFDRSHIFRLKSGVECCGRLVILTTFNVLPIRYVSFFRFLAKPFFKPRFKNKTKFDKIIIDSYEWLPFIDSLMADKIIYRPTDIYSVVNENILQIETDFVRDLDIPVVCMSSISKTFYQKHGFNVILECQNGVHKSFYNLNNKVVKNTDLPLLNLSAIYVGAIDDRIDLDWLSFMCKTFPNIEFDIFSPADSRGLSLLEFSNLHFKGAVEFGDLPSLLRNYNFGLLPFNDHRKNQSRSPMKLYEYLASGLKVLTTEYFTDERGLSIKIDRETLWSEEVLRSAINISPEDQLSNQYLVRSMDWDSITGRIIEAMNDH